MMPAAMDVGKARHDAACHLRHRHELDGDLGDDGEHAFAADHHRHQVQPRCVERQATELHRLAIGEETLHLQHVVQRETVLEAVHPARVFRHVAADGAGDLAAWVRRVVKTMRRSGFADGEVAHAALHTCGACIRIDLEDLVELGKAQRHAQPMRQGAPRQPGARAARHHRDVEPMARAQDSGDLLVCFGKGHHQRLLPIGGEPVAFIGHGVFGVPQQRMHRKHRAEFGDHLCAPLSAFIHCGGFGSQWSVHGAMGRLRQCNARKPAAKSLRL